MGVDYHLCLLYRLGMEPAEGLRSRKKARTRAAIEEAALELFAEHGYDATTVEQIATRADVSTTTFFRYFVSKGEVLVGPQTEQVPVLQAAIRACPAGESDMEAVRRGVQAAWVAGADPDRTARIVRALISSAAAMGMRDVVGSGWSTAVSEALADRRGLAPTDPGCRFAAQVGLLVFARALADWVGGRCRQPLDEAVDDAFGLFGELCREWAR